MGTVLREMHQIVVVLHLVTEQVLPISVGAGSHAPSCLGINGLIRGGKSAVLL